MKVQYFQINTDYRRWITREIVGCYQNSWIKSYRQNMGQINYVKFVISVLNHVIMVV